MLYFNGNKTNRVFKDEQEYNLITKGSTTVFEKRMEINGYNMFNTANVSAPFYLTRTSSTETNTMHPNVSITLSTSGSPTYFNSLSLKYKINNASNMFSNIASTSVYSSLTDNLSKGTFLFTTGGNYQYMFYGATDTTTGVTHQLINNINVNEDWTNISEPNFSHAFMYINNTAGVNVFRPGFYNKKTWCTYDYYYIERYNITGDFSYTFYNCGVSLNNYCIIGNGDFMYAFHNSYTIGSGNSTIYFNSSDSRFTYAFYNAKLNNIGHAYFNNAYLYYTFYNSELKNIYYFKCNNSNLYCTFDNSNVNNIDFLEIINCDISNTFRNCYNLQYINNLQLHDLNAPSMFTNCYNLAILNNSYFDNIKEASYMFRNCYNLAYIMNTSRICYLNNIYNTKFMFDNCHKFHQNFNINNINNTYCMFNTVNNYDYPINLFGFTNINYAQHTFNSSSLYYLNNIKINVTATNTFANCFNMRWYGSKIPYVNMNNIINANSCFLRCIKFINQINNLYIPSTVNTLAAADRNNILNIFKLGGNAVWSNLTISGHNTNMYMYFYNNTTINYNLCIGHGTTTTWYNSNFRVYNTLTGTTNVNLYIP